MGLRWQWALLGAVVLSLGLVAVAQTQGEAPAPSSGGPAVTAEPAEDLEEHEEGGWGDLIHWIGWVGGGLALVAIVMGIAIVARGGKGRSILARMKARKGHIVVGMVAVVLAIVHTVGRALEEGDLGELLDPKPPLYLALYFLLLALTGAVRHKPVGPLQSVPAIGVWLHRLFVVLMLWLLVRHILYQYTAWSAS